MGAGKDDPQQQVQVHAFRVTSESASRRSLKISCLLNTRVTDTTNCDSV